MDLRACQYMCGYNGSKIFCYIICDVSSISLQHGRLYNKFYSLCIYPYTKILGCLNDFRRQCTNFVNFATAHLTFIARKLFSLVVLYCSYLLTVVFVYIPLDYLPACDDVHDVYREVYTVAARWSDISFALYLPISQEEAIRKETRGDDSARCLRMVLSKWLRKSYNYDKYGLPTWRMLVKAVGDPFGGNDCALAETIANKHPGMYSNELLVTCMNMNEIYYSERNKLLFKNAPTHSNQRLAAPLERFCAKLLGDCKEFDPEIVSSTTSRYLLGRHVKISGALCILLVIFVGI